MKINVFNTVDETLKALADYFVALAQESIEEKGSFSVALSGGSSPKKLYELLAASYAEAVNWQRVYFFFGDERNVPKEDSESNYRMARIALFDPLEISNMNVYPVDTTQGPAAAATMYTQAIGQYFNSEEEKFDLILLGLGDNSHTASLFPHTTILTDESVSVKEVYLPEQDVYRISFTAPLINQAKNIAYLVYGQGKAEAVKHIIEDDLDIQEYPAQLIQPLNGDLQWFLDTEAASALTEKEE